MLSVRYWLFTESRTTDTTPCILWVKSVKCVCADPPCFLQTLICQSELCLLSLLWLPKLTATSGELSHTAWPLPQPCETLWSMTCSFEHHRSRSSLHKNTKDSFIRIPRKPQRSSSSFIYQDSLASQLQTSEPCLALQAWEKVFCLREWMQSVPLKTESLPVWFYANKFVFDLMLKLDFF